MPKDVTTYEEAYMYLLALTEMVGTRLRKNDLKATVVAVSVRSSTFENYSHQCVIDATSNTTDIYKCIQKLFRDCWKNEPIRHLGVRATSLQKTGDIQISFFDFYKDNSKKDNLDKAIDEIRFKYGAIAIFRANFLNTNIRPIKGGAMDDSDFNLTAKY